MARSILGLVRLAATLVVALPVALLGLDFLVRGQTVMGAGFLAVAGLVVAVEQLLTTPADVPELVAKRTVGRVAKTDDEE